MVVVPTDTFVLDAGDMLYLPPHYAHEGVAVGECMTYSIGFKAESPQSLAQELLPRLVDMAPEEHQARYADPRQAATLNAAQIPAALQQFAHKAVLQALKHPGDLNCALGELLSEPKPQVWFEAQALPRRLCVWYLLP